MNSCELVSVISSIACIVSKNVSDKDIELLAVIFTQLDDSLATITLNNQRKC